MKWPHRSSPVFYGLTINADAKFEQAAERRKYDEIACGWGIALSLHEVERAANESIKDIIDPDDSPLEPWSCPACTLHNEPIVLQCAACFTVRPRNLPGIANKSRAVAEQSSIRNPSGSISDSRYIERGQSRVNADKQPNNAKKSSHSTLHSHQSVNANATPADSGQWSCISCTFTNDRQTNHCAVCLKERPGDPSVGWRCMTCGEAGMPHEFWSCRFCGAIKTESSEALS